jgi:hypothetical protein
LTYPSTSVLTSDGTGTAVLARPSGFGEAFGEAFGGLVITATATLDAPSPGTAVIETEVTVLAELLLV